MRCALAVLGVAGAEGGTGGVGRAEEWWRRADSRQADVNEWANVVPGQRAVSTRQKESQGQEEMNGRNVWTWCANLFVIRPLLSFAN
jgi:hypothetical protein